MNSFRNPKYVEGYEDVVFEPETALVTALNANQKKEGHRFVADNTGEVTPFDWYNARISLAQQFRSHQLGEAIRNKTFQGYF